MSRAQLFWDDVFTHERREWVADHTPEYFFGILNQAGPFEKDFHQAFSVLDVGPGEARLLQTHPGIRQAIEVSAVNRQRLERWSIRAFPPDVFALHEEVDLAWSVSCFPHCDYLTQITLLSIVHRALRPGGIFYLEHVMQKVGFPECPEDARLPAGRYHVNPADIPWPGNSWRWIERNIGGSDCPLRGWVGRGVK